MGELLGIPRLDPKRPSGVSSHFYFLRSSLCASPTLSNLTQTGLSSFTSPLMGSYITPSANFLVTVWVNSRSMLLSPASSNFSVP